MNFIKNNAYFIAGMIVCLIAILIICSCGWIIPSGTASLETEIIYYINSTSADYGLEPVAYNYRLMDVARGRSQDMISREYFSHYTPEGKNITHVLYENMVFYKNFGENLGKATPAECGTARVFMEAWMNSTGHRDCILKPYYTDIGVGVVEEDGCRIVTVILIRK